MTNKQLLEKLQEDMEMRNFSHYTKDSYYRKAKEITEYFGKFYIEKSINFRKWIVTTSETLVFFYAQNNCN